MGEETARLRQEIEQTRQDLTRDVDRLTDKTSPSRIVERRVERTRGRLVGLKEKIMGSSEPRHTYGPTYTDDVYATGSGATEYGAGGSTLGSARDAAQDAVSGVRERAEGSPFAAGLVAFGIGWLVSSLLPASDAETQAAQRAGEVAREHGGPLLDQARDAAQQVGTELKDHAQEAAQQVKVRAQEAAGTVREEARSSS